MGEKTALSLISAYGTLEGVYEHIDEIKQPKLKASLIEYKDQAFLSRKLGTIVRNLELCASLEDLKRKEINRKELLNVFRKLEFESIISKMNLASAEVTELPPAPEELKITHISAAEDLKKWIAYLLNQKNISVLQLIDREDSYSSRLSGWLCAPGMRFFISRPGLHSPRI